MTLSDHDRLVITHAINDIDRVLERGNATPTERWNLLEAKETLSEYAIETERIT